MTKSDRSSAAEGILRFCDYLAHRLHTENVELLRRIVTEFYATPRHFVTVHSLLAIGFPAVTIVPVDNADETALEDARRLRRHVRRGRVAPMDVHAMHHLYTALRGTIELTNWHMLLTMYREFCTGVESTVKQFVERREAAIAIFPITPINGPLVEHAEPQISMKQDIADVDVEMPNVITHEVARIRSRVKWRGYDETMAMIHHAVGRVERKAPWERMFDVSTIVYPFNADAHPDLADRLRKFWEIHARAVWERHFWHPFEDTREIQGNPSYTRKLRQQYAAAHFVKTVVLPIYDAFGARFFVELDAQQYEIHWWWYRGPVVDLGKMAATVGVERCLQYVKKQALKRVPRLPSAFNCNENRPSSMWSTMVSTKHVAHAIEELVEVHAARAEAKKQRRI